MSEQSLDPEISVEAGTDQDSRSELEKENENLRNEIAETKDQMLRAVAELQNTIRRQRAEWDIQRKFASEGLLRDLIPSLDNLDRTLRAVEKGAGLEALVDGIKATSKQLNKVLENHHLKRIEPQGQMFDPELHEAIATNETDEHPEDTVTDVIEAGYILHDRVIRPSRVRVAKPL